MGKRPMVGAAGLDELCRCPLGTTMDLTQLLESLAMLCPTMAILHHGTGHCSTMLCPPLPSSTGRTSVGLLCTGSQFNVRKVNILHRVGYQTDIRNVSLRCISLLQDAILVQHWLGLPTPLLFATP
jgi:hypothetical protein